MVTFREYITGLDILSRKYCTENLSVSISILDSPEGINTFVNNNRYHCQRSSTIVKTP